MMKVKTFLKNNYQFWLKVLGILGGSVLLGGILLAVVYMLPTGRIEQNVAESAHTMRAEGSHPTITATAYSMLDNFTDSIMLLESSYSGNEAVISKSMHAFRNHTENTDPVTVLSEHYLDNKSFTGTETYNRYWHGYLILLKPLLIIFNYDQIRVINTVCQVSLMIVIIWVLIKKQQKILIIPFLLIYGLMMPVALARSLQFSTCFYIGMIGCLVVLLMPQKKRSHGLLFTFLGIGIATAYFDFLTYPLLTFGLPAVVSSYLWAVDSKGDDWRIALLNLCKLGVCWIIGYLGMWFGKWVLGTLLTGENFFAEAMSSISFRTVGVSAEITAVFTINEVVSTNYLLFFKTPFLISTLDFWIAMITLLVMEIKQKLTKPNTLSKILKNMTYVAIPFILIALLPLAWYLVTTNHSGIHYFFTNKLCTESVFAICGMLCAWYRRLSLK